VGLHVSARGLRTRAEAEEIRKKKMHGKGWKVVKASDASPSSCPI
jgi:hypothetical protein